uniref:Uncharacterized protein n=1 Tax=Panagrolaimus sp. PS1159 TaxID=55785 RepID=A0AC35FQ40_9BILA
MFKKLRKTRFIFALFSVMIFLVLYNIYRKNYEIEFGQPLVTSELIKNDKKNAEHIASQEEEDGGEEEEENVDKEENENLNFGFDGDIRAAVDNLGNNNKKPKNAGKPAVANIENGGENYND